MQATPDDGLWKVRKRTGQFGKFIHQFQTEIKTLIRKLERNLIRLYRQNVYMKWCNFLVKRIFWKRDQNWRKDLQLTPTHIFKK